MRRLKLFEEFKGDPDKLVWKHLPNGYLGAFLAWGPRVKRYLIYKDSGTFYLQIDGKDVIKGTLLVTQGAAQDDYNKTKKNTKKVTEKETGAYKAPKFATKPADDDTGYNMVAKEFGATPAPKKKKK